MIAMGLDDRMSRRAARSSGCTKNVPMDKVEVEVIDAELRQGVVKRFLHVLGSVEVVRELTRTGL